MNRVIKKLGYHLEQLAIEHINSTSGVCFYEPKVPQMLIYALKKNGSDIENRITKDDEAKVIN